MNICKMRTAFNLSQEKLAEEVGVSKQAIQKWESGASVPDTKNLIALSRIFRVPIDAIVFDRSERDYEGMTFFGGVYPQYAEVPVWESYMKELNVEYRQCIDEGKDLAAYRDYFAAVQRMPDAPEKKEAADLAFRLVEKAGTAAGYRYEEPSDLEKIRGLCENRQGTAAAPGTEILREKIRGAWRGRICGCLLGKTVEGMRKEELHGLLRETGNFPMHRYILSTDVTDEVCARYSFALRESCYADRISCAPVDDDTNYTVLALKILREYGREFTAEDVGTVWKKSQPIYAYCTAERVAYKNLINGFAPPASAEYQNPYREWIGAQIRADCYGYVNPGNPEAAAGMAWKDASVSAVKNGIYGAMFAAAMTAWAAVCSDAEQVVRAGLGQIPATSRLYEEIDKILEIRRKGGDYGDCVRYLYSRYDDHDEYDWCHTVPNAMIVAAALLCGGGDYGKSVCLAVQTGFDTDCNGATTGSIVGMMKGESAVGPAWYSPVNGQLDTSIFGVGRVKIDDLAEKTASLALL